MVDESKPLSKWVKSLYGEGRKYRSGRRLSAAAGKNNNAVSDIESTGRGTVPTVVAIARAADYPVLEILKLMEILKEEDFKSSSLTQDELQLLSDFRRLSITDQTTVLRVTASLLGDNADVNESNILSQIDSSEPVSSEEKTPHPSGK